jgi:RecJ-like exonuclease
MSNQDFIKTIQQASSLIYKHITNDSFIRLVTHNDADGLSSGGILTKVVLRKKARFKISSEKKLDDNIIKRIKQENPDLVLFSDFGSSHIDIISENLSQDVIVLDHHLPIKYEAENITHINPMLHDIDGAKEISASGICYLIAKSIDPENIDLAYLGIIGALGDQQDKGERKSLIGLNKLIEFDAESKNMLEKHLGLIFYGYETRPIAKAIAYTTIPYIPELSGNEGNCIAFLKKIGLEILDGERFRSLSDLSNEEKTKLFSSLSNHMISTGCDSTAIHQLIGTIYTIKLEDPSTPLRNGREYGSLLNACGRMGKQGVGLSIVIGDREEAMRTAQETLDTYRKTIGRALDWVQVNNKVEEMEHIYVIRAEDKIDDSVIGVISGILLSQGFLKKMKPIIATAYSEDEQYKVSARGVDELVGKGLHMGMVLQEAAEKVDGGGGGHDIAAGAYIPLNQENNFFVEVNRLVAKMLSIKPIPTV